MQKQKWDNFIKKWLTSIWRKIAKKLLLTKCKNFLQSAKKKKHIVKKEIANSTKERKSTHRLLRCFFDSINFFFLLLPLPLTFSSFWRCRRVNFGIKCYDILNVFTTKWVIRKTIYFVKSSCSTVIWIELVKKVISRNFLLR